MSIIIAAFNAVALEITSLSYSRNSFIGNFSTTVASIPAMATKGVPGAKMIDDGLLIINDCNCRQMHNNSSKQTILDSFISLKMNYDDCDTKNESSTQQLDYGLEILIAWESVTAKPEINYNA